LNQSNVNLSSNYSFEFTTNNTTLDDVNSSGVILNLTKTIYNEEDHELVLSFNLPITESTINTSGDIWLSTTGGGTGYTQLLTVPLTCSLDTDKDDVTITLVSGDYSVIEGWNLVEEDLQIKLSANIFCGQGRWNSLIDYTNVTYTASGEYLPVAHETFIVPSGYTRFQVLETYPKNQQPNVSGVSRITMTFTGLLNRTCHLYDWITVEDNPVL
jgi:hypothetical protein